MQPTRQTANMAAARLHHTHTMAASLPEQTVLGLTYLLRIIGTVITRTGVLGFGMWKIYKMAYLTLSKF